MKVLLPVVILNLSKNEKQKKKKKWRRRKKYDMAYIILYNMLYIYFLMNLENIY